MINKQVKEYSKRQRIDLNKKDGFAPGENVVIMSATEYDGIKDNILKLTRQLRNTENKLSSKDNEIQIYKDREQNLKQIIEDVTAPIYENHKKELKIKDDKLNQLRMQLELMKSKTNQYNLELMGLNAIDIAIFRKHKKLIKNYNEEITLLGVDPETIDADTKAISENPGKDQEQ